MTFKAVHAGRIMESGRNEYPAGIHGLALSSSFNPARDFSVQWFPVLFQPKRKLC